MRSSTAESDPFATALLIDDGVIAWVGDDAGARVHVDIADRVIDLGGAFLAPGFVDSHIHATATGLQLTGMDLTGAASARDILEAGGGEGKRPTRWIHLRARLG